MTCQLFQQQFDKYEILKVWGHKVLPQLNGTFSQELVVFPPLFPHFCVQDFPCSIGFWCILGVSVEIWLKNIIYQFIERQTQFGKAGGALIEPK